ncbi:MAG: hypothetical protein HRU20_10180 [Pseudomonadales bacterium]|nr:hypothetical protein [Pseudomonadales bacterium]
MPKFYEVYAVCPLTKERVRTECRVEGPEFKRGEDISGTYNCRKCNQTHVWHCDDRGIVIAHGTE